MGYNSSFEVETVEAHTPKVLSLLFSAKNGVKWVIGSLETLMYGLKMGNGFKSELVKE